MYVFVRYVKVVVHFLKKDPPVNCVKGFSEVNKDSIKRGVVFVCCLDGFVHEDNSILGASGGAKSVLCVM